MGDLPTISVIIPTRNSAHILPVCLSGIKSQQYPRKNIEVIISDNESSDQTLAVARKYGAKIVSVKGEPPLVCQQRNLGAKTAKGEYLLFLDHDMELSKGLMMDFAQKITTEKDVDAWFIPEKIITGSKLLTKIRNFERNFYNQTPIDAVRIIKRTTFFNTETQYDPLLSGGPADWDLDIQLKEIGCRFGSLTKPLFHHEERLGGFLKYISKKGDWSGGISLYKKKWQKKYRGKYHNVIDKQLGLKYRIFIVFFEKDKWKKIIVNLHLYIMVLCIKLAMLCQSVTKKK